MHQYAEARAAADPANTEWQRDLSVSPQQARGCRGERPGTWPPPAPPTRPAWTSPVRLAAADPANTGWQRDLSVSHDRLGDVGGGGRGPGRRSHRLPGQPGHRACGWPPPTPPTPSGSVTCRSATTSSGMWRRRPGTWPPPAPPTRPAWTSGSGWPPPTQPTPGGSVTCRSATTGSGMSRSAAGDLAAARDRLPGQPGHRRAAGRRRPSQHRSGSVTCRSATTSSGMSRPRPGTWPPPATAYQASLDIRVRLAAADPANTEWQRDLSVSHDRLGDVAVGGRGPGRRPRPPTRPAWTSRVRLAAADPANTEWQRDLSVSHDKLGDVAGAAGDLAAARTAYQASLDIRCGWPPPTPPTPSGSATCRSATTSSGTWRSAAGDLAAARDRLPGQPGHPGPAGCG